jgi:DNA-binding IclR family transcriptional regulator
MARREKTDYIIHTVSNALNLFELFNRKGEGLSVSEISQRLRLPKNNVLRLVTTLELRGYLEQDKLTDRYKVGLRALDLGQTYLRQGGLLRRARPVLADISRTFHETTYLARLEKRHIIYLDAVESDRKVHVVSRLGIRLPAYSTASGKVHLAFLPEKLLDRLYPDEALEEYTPRTHRSKQALRDDLHRVAKRGYAVDDEELEEQVRCVAVPVRDYTRTVIGALSVSGPSFRMDRQRIEEEIAPQLLGFAAELSTALGDLP